MQCGPNVIREEFFLKKDQKLGCIIDALRMKGYKQDDEMEPILTIHFR